MVFGGLAVVNAAVNWLLILVGDLLDVAVEIGGASLFAFAAVAVGCAIVALIVIRCHRSTHRGVGLAALAMLLAVLAVGGFCVPLLLLLSHMPMF